MERGKDLENARLSTYHVLNDLVRQALTEVMLPQLEEIRAEMRRLNERLDAQPAPATATSDLTKEGERIPTLAPLSPQARAYVNMRTQEVREQTEQAAAAWAQKKAKNPDAATPTVQNDAFSKVWERLRVLEPSPEEQAYLEQVDKELREESELRAAEWAQQKAKDPDARIFPKNKKS